MVTYARLYVSLSNLPQWDRSRKLLTKLHITSQGTIEDDGAGLLQVDFAHKYVCHTVMLFDHESPLFTIRVCFCAYLFS